MRDTTEWRRDHAAAIRRVLAAADAWRDSSAAELHSLAWVPHTPVEVIGLRGAVDEWRALHARHPESD